MAFPATRLRRLRQTGVLRGLVRETELAVSHLVYPMFVVASGPRRTPIAELPGIDHLSIDGAVEEAGHRARARHPGRAAVRAAGEQGRRGLRRLGRRRRDPARHAGDQVRLSGPSWSSPTSACASTRRTATAACCAPTGSSTTTRRSSCWPAPRSRRPQAGADAVAPSDMMDGRVGRAPGRARRPRPVRDAADRLQREVRLRVLRPVPRRRRLARRSRATARATRWIPANALEAVREAKLDADEGADIVMVKPALPYLDVIRRVKDETGMPVAAYNVSGEYAMVKAAAAPGPARRARRRARGADRHPPRRRRHRDHLPRQGRRPMAAARSQGPLAAGRLGRPARRDRQEAPQPHAGLVRAAAGPVRGRGRAGRASPRTRCWSASSTCSTSGSSARSRRSSTRARSATQSMLVAAKVDAEHPHRAAQFINSHPGVTHNYLRNHDFNLWFTLAVEPAAEARPRRHARRDRRPGRAPSRSASCRR